jgi:hypothetical protein
VGESEYKTKRRRMMKFVVSITAGEGEKRVSSGAIGYIEGDDVHDAARKLDLGVQASGRCGAKLDKFVPRDWWHMEVFLDEIVEVTPRMLYVAGEKLFASQRQQDEQQKACGSEG